MLDCPKDRSRNVTYLEAPVERVWHAVATPRGSVYYLTDKVETTGDPDCPKKGDRLVLYYGDITNRAVVMVVDPFRQFVLSDAYDSMAPDGTVDLFHVRTTYLFEPEGAFTKLTLEVQGFAENTHGQWFRECLEMGWRRSLANLKSVLELGMDLRTELFSYPRLGVTNCTVNEEQSRETGIRAGEGNYLLDVFPGGPADEAGMRPGDVITAIGNVPITDYSSFVRAISGHYGKREPVEIVYNRIGVVGRVLVDVSIDRMFTGLIDGTAEAQEQERQRRQRLAGARSASIAIWSTSKKGATFS